MKIKMLETRLGSPNGVLVLPYTEGEEYELPDSLGRVFLTEGWARAVDGRSKAPRKKDKGAALENKSTTKIKKQ
jgi:hypothetical protein